LYSARATSAAPTCFTPFVHSPSEQVYVDGGLYHNNPVKIADAESKAIWPNNRAYHPDILLSLGTGFDKPKTTADETALLPEAMLDLTSPELPKDRGKRLYLADLMTLGIDHIMNALDCEQTWHEWLQTRAPERHNERRYRRLTVRFDDPIQMDAVKDMPKCRKAVEEWVKEPVIESIADQLIASCFYYHFKQKDIERLHGGGFECRGKFPKQLLSRTPIFWQDAAD
jgi:hypothetical protein